MKLWLKLIPALGALAFTAVLIAMSAQSPLYA
jgi:hypothetical protein